MFFFLTALNFEQIATLTFTANEYIRHSKKLYMIDVFGLHVTLHTKYCAACHLPFLYSMSVTTAMFLDQYNLAIPFF